LHPVVRRKNAPGPAARKPLDRSGSPEGRRGRLLRYLPPSRGRPAGAGARNREEPADHREARGGRSEPGGGADDGNELFHERGSGPSLQVLRRALQSGREKTLRALPVVVRATSSKGTPLTSASFRAV